MAIGQKHKSALLFKTELLLSETSSRTCPSIISYTDTHRVIGDQANLVLRKNMKSSFQYIDRFIGFNPEILFIQMKSKIIFISGENMTQIKNNFFII